MENKHPMGCEAQLVWKCLFTTTLFRRAIFSHKVGQTDIVRPPDIVCRRTYILPVFLSFFGSLISEIAERNWTKIGHMVGSKCNLKTHVWNLGYPPTNRGPKNHLFWTTLRFNGKFNGLYLGNETWFRQPVKCVDNYKMSPTSSQNVMNFGP